jgi:CubicO group peptidase (beta-lactamase class C family)
MRPVAELSGLCFSALTCVLEQRLGRSFRQLLAENIRDRLKMERSVPGQNSEEPRYAPVLRDLAKPYHIDRSRNIVPAAFPPLRISASAGLISTVLDLARYDAAIDHHTLIRRETQELAWTPAKSPDQRPFPYALGWFVQPHHGIRLVWHYGYWPGSFSSLYLKVPAKNVTLILLANGDGLSREFPLGFGDVRRSAFARAFLDTAL